MAFDNDSSLSRRELLQAGLLAGVGAGLPGSLLAAEHPLSGIHKPIPSSGQKIPVIGVGTNRFGNTDYNVDRDIIKRTYELGGTIIDTAALYGDSEDRIGKALYELKLNKKMFICTKFNAPDAKGTLGGMESVERSFNRLGKVDLLYIHFVDSVESMMPLLLDLKKQHRVRYIGITNVNRPQDNVRLAQCMRKYPIDFIQVTYNLGDRSAEAELLPLAHERKIAVSAAVPMGGGRNLLLNQIGNRQLPKWAAQYGIKSWGQFFLKYVVSHPAITCAVPGSTKVEHVDDNQAAGRGRLPDAAGRRRMEDFWAIKA